MRQTDMAILSRSGGGYSDYLKDVLSLCVVLRPHVRPLTPPLDHTPRSWAIYWPYTYALSPPLPLITPLDHGHILAIYVRPLTPTSLDHTPHTTSTPPLQVLGVEHSSVAATLNNLAGLCFSHGDIEDAKDYYEESLRLRRQAFGDEHPSVAESLNNIGLLLFAQGSYTDAQPLFERAITIKKEAFGDKHLSTASSQHNLAILLHKLKRFGEAETLYAVALHVRTAFLGPAHPDTQSTMEKLNELGGDKTSAGELVSV